MPRQPADTIRRALCAAAMCTLGACGGGEHEAASDGPATLSYPDTARVDVSDDYHGTVVPDPYRWMEDLDSAAVDAWVASQNAIAQPYLESLPERESIIQRLEQLWNYERYSVPERVANRYFFERNDGLQDQDVLFVADSLDAEPRIVIDPNGFSDDATVALAGYSISHDGRLIAYSVSDGGTDWKTWRIRDVDTGEELDETLTGTKFTDVAWDVDSGGFYYSRYPVAADGKADGQQQVSVYHHRLGTPQSEDRFVYRVPDSGTRNAYADVTRDGRYLILNVSEGYEANGVYYQRLGEDGPEGEVMRLFDAWDALYSVVDTVGDRFYVYTTNGAPRGRVIAVDVGNPQPERWAEVVPQSDATLESVSVVGEQFFARYLKDVRSVVYRYDRQGEFVGELALPGYGTAYGFTGKPDQYETFYGFSSYTSPPQVLRFDIEEERSTVFRRADIDIQSNAFETTQVFYNSKDGTLVPMSITHRKGLELNGRHPTLLYGYGGFNISLTPSYSTTRMVWLEMGGVLAIPNLRGGGEYGDAWHEAGTRLAKQNVFDDFIAAGEYLIDKGYTSTAHLAIQGRSNGGLLVGAVLTQRPDLFGAALPGVGVLDMLRYHTASANAAGWSSDFGLSSDPREFAAQYAYSPVHNVAPGVCYPPTLITTADRDDRVVPWHSYKFAAALQHAQSCSEPVLIRVETRAGHGAGKPTWMVIEDYADQWAFLARHLGMTFSLPGSG
jgi:prolyl oligopeptidase